MDFSQGQDYNTHLFAFSDKSLWKTGATATEQCVYHMGQNLLGVYWDVCMCVGDYPEQSKLTHTVHLLL